MMPRDDDRALAPPAEVTLAGGRPFAPEPGVEGDEVASLLDSREAGGAAVRGGALRVAGYVVNVGLGVLGAAFLFRHLGVTGAGVYVLAMSIATIVSGLSDLGLTALGVRELSVREAEGRSRLMSNLLGLRICMTLTGIAGSVIFTIAVGYRPVIVAGVAIAGAGLMLQTVQGTLALSLTSRLRLGLLTATELGRQLLSTALIIVLVAIGAGLLWFIAITVPLGVLLLVVTAWLVRHEVPLRPRFDAREWRSLGRELLPYSAAVAIGVIYFRLSVIIVSLSASSKQLGYFSTSFRVIEVLIVVPALMVTGVFPIFARSAINDHERLAYAVSRVFVVALIVGVAVSLALALGAQIAITVIGGSKFAGAIGVLRIQGIGLIGTFVAAVWGMMLLSLRRYRLLILVTLSSLLAGIVLVLVLTSADGARGAALATAITEIGGAVAIPFLLRRTDPHIVPGMGAVPRVALAAALGAAVVLIPGLPAVVTVALATVIYLAVLLALRVIPAELFDELHRIRTRYHTRGRLV